MTGQTGVQTEIWRPILTLILTSLAVMGSPGPSTVSVTAVGAVYGFRRSLPYACGLILGTIAVLLAVGGGIVTILLSIPHGRPVLFTTSAVYIGYLAVKIATAPPLVSQPGDVTTPILAGGFLLAVANPKAYLAIAAVFAGTRIYADDHEVDAVVKAALLGLMIVVIHIGWLLAGAVLSRALRDPIISRVVNVLLAMTLVITTVTALLR